MHPRFVRGWVGTSVRLPKGSVGKATDTSNSAQSKSRTRAKLLIKAVDAILGTSLVDLLADQEPKRRKVMAKRRS